MTIRNLNYFFAPQSVAIIGATSRADSVGSVLVHNLVRGRLDAPVFAVNPKRSHVFTLPAYEDVASLPIVPDLAVIATPPETVPGLIAELGEKGTKAVVVITAGFSGGGHVCWKRIAAGNARCCATPSIAHHRSELPRNHDPACRPQCELRAELTRGQGAWPS